MAEVFSNYVKFKRGTPEAYENLQHKDSDTLYFIYEEDELTGELYLGSKLIAGAGEINGATALKDLTDDVLLSENLDNNHCLVYDISQKKWVNKPILSVIENFIGANSTSNGVAGLVPAPKAGETGLFLRSDGTWSEIVTASATTVLQTIVTTGETHLEAISRVLVENNKKANVGDIIILQELICDPDNYQHIAYVYSGQQWMAMDGNYNAENVYLASDLTITADVGVQKVGSAGSKILNTTGKNLKQVLDLLLAERTLPKRTNPTVSVTASKATAYEVGTPVSLSFNATLDKGSYTYGPDTEVTATQWSAVFNGETINADSGTFSEVYITDGFSKRITVTATHTKGVAPKDNLGNVVTDNDELINCQIQAGDKTNYSNYVSGYRNGFYGSFTTPIELTSDNIRGLTAFKSTNNSINNMPIVEGAKQIIIALPVGRKITKVADDKAYGTDIISRFVNHEVNVAGASEGFEKDYNVYVYAPDAALSENTYDITIANE